MVARMRRGLHRLTALLDPLHRPAQLHGQRAERDVFGIEHRLHAEAATHVGRDDADAILGEAKHLAQQMAQEVRHLGGRPQRELALARAPVREATAALERRRALPVGAERALEHQGGAGQRRLDVAPLEAAREERIVGRGLVHPRGATAHRHQHVDRRRQRLGVDAHQGRGVLDPVAIGADDGGHRLADVAHDRPGQDRLLGLDVGRQRRARSDAKAREARIATGAHGNDAGVGGRRRSVDLPQPRVGVEAAHEHHVQLPRQLDVADVAPAAGQEARVLPPAHGRAGGHGKVSLSPGLIGNTLTEVVPSACMYSCGVPLSIGKVP